MLLRNHFYNWYEDYLVHHPIFVRYARIWDNLESLADFLELPGSAIEEFPEKMERSSCVDEIPEETIRRLKHLYGPFSEELMKLNDVEIRGWHLRGKRMHVFTSRNFRIAIRNRMRIYLSGPCNLMAIRAR